MNRVHKCWVGCVKGGSVGLNMKLKVKAVKSYVKAHIKENKSKVVSPRPRWDDFQVPNISQKDREDLESVFSVEKVWEALCDYDENKASDPGRLNLNFVKKNWDWIKEDFMKFLHVFYEDGWMISDFNSTFIALIPKIKNLESLKDYKPISLVGSIYKVVAKILANRLKRVMNALIGKTQMAFVNKRQIVDSFVIAEEVIYSWKKDGKGGLLVKLYFEKAYNSVDHDFLLEVLVKMAFGWPLGRNGGNG
ncbi:hypothetical protein Ddye_022537 [Dipteronia dyeriana]|uniref:Reverse transcriptase domain-containing protein n=1 Tax=Dipteronia dyeriana TaxID=168575 RepID=A0AAD9TS43_9ROSI|nr:hypothetical protein Ddye_022537 [Dipteronia dyeriana]